MRIDALPPRVVVGIMALCFMLLAAFFSQRWFGHLPHVLDSHTMYMHSKMMASGYLCMPPDPNPDFFSVFDTYTQNGYCSASFPGHVFLLTIGQLLQVPWIVNPFMGALLLVAVFILGREIDGRQTGYIAAGLTMLSPFIVAMASEFMNSITTGFCLILFLWSYIRLLKTWRPKYAVIAGVLVGYSFLTRVQATVPFALPMGLHALYMLYKSPRERFKPIVLMALLFASSVAMLCAYNYRVTGDPFITAYQVSDNSSLSMYIMKFAHWSAWENIYNDFARATAQYNQLHTGIFGWQTSSLVFAMLLLLTRQQPPYSGLLTCCVVSQYLGLVFVHGMHGSVFEPRYVFESAPIYILWTAAWFRRMPAMAGILIRKAHGFTREQYIGASAGVLIVLSACALPHKVADLYAKYIDNYWQGNLPYLRAIMRRAQHPSLVFLGPEKAFEYTVFMQPAQDTDRIIFVRDTGDNYWKMMERYPDRYYYRVENKMMKEIVCDVEHSPYEKY